MTNKPRYPKPNAAAIPAALKDLRQWVVWRARWIEGKDSKPGKWTKVPYRADGGGEASSTDPATWATFLDAAAAYRGGGFDGVGFVLTEAAGIVGFDLDDSFVGEDGNPTEEAKEYLDLLNSYTERSPSGQGFRVFVRGTLPPEGRKRGDFECYSWGRFLTVTGGRLMQYPATIETRQEAIETIHARVWPPKPVQERRQISGAGFTGGDADLLAKAFTAKNGDKFRALYSGDTSGYPGASEADQALCSLLAFWTGGDAVRMDALFRASGLMRDKWEEARGARTYGERTVDFATLHCTETYSPPGANNAERVRTEAAGVAEASPPLFDGPPRSVSVELLPVPAFGCELLPGPLRGWVADIALRSSCPVEYVASAAMVALSSLVGRRLGIRPKRHDDWTVIPNLWGAVVGSPGTLKTPAVSEALKPLYRLEAAARQEYNDARELYEADVLAAKAAQEATKKELGKAARRGESRESLRALAVEAQTEDADKPTRARYIVNDCTVEKLGEILSENPHGVLLHRDELTGFFRGLERSGHESDRAFYLEAWNGSASFTYDRIGRGTVDIDACCVSLFGTIQPGPLCSYLRGAASGEEADGFASRLQLMVYPDPPKEFRNIDRYPDAEARAAAQSVFERLSKRVAQAEEENAPPFRRFDDAAQTFFDDWRESLENRLLSGRESPLMLMHLAKYRSLMPSLALLLHLSDTEEGPVRRGAAKAAAAWCAFLEAHARRIYHAATEGDAEGAGRLSERLRQGKLQSPFTFRDVHQKAWGGLTTPEQVNAALARLIESHWIAGEEVKGENGGRPTTRYHVNPSVYAGEKNLAYAGQETLKTLKTPSEQSFEGFEGSSPGESEKFSSADSAFEEFSL